MHEGMFAGRVAHKQQTRLHAVARTGARLNVADERQMHNDLVDRRKGVIKRATQAQPCVRRKGRELGRPHTPHALHAATCHNRASMWQHNTYYTDTDEIARCADEVFAVQYMCKELATCCRSKDAE